MGTLPASAPLKLLRWNSGGTALENVTIADLLDQIATQSQPDPTDVANHRYWIDTANVAGAGISLNAVSFSMTPAAPVASVGPRVAAASRDLSLTMVAPLAQAVNTGSFATNPAAINLSLTPNAPTPKLTGAISAAALNVSLTTAVPTSVVAAGDTTAPVVTAFTVGTPSGSSVPISTFTATDAVGVTGYLVTESSTPPVSGAAGWATPAPSSYTAVGTGSVTLYPWAKDAAGNVSSVFGSPRSVTISTGGAIAQEAAWVSAEGSTGNLTVAVGAGTAGRRIYVVIAASNSDTGTAGTYAVSGGGLSWGSVVQRDNRATGGGSYVGVVEVWSAVDATGSAFTATATPGSGSWCVAARAWALTVTSGSATGATVPGFAESQAATAVITPQAVGSLMYAAGIDWNSNTARTLRSGQSLVTMTSGAATYAQSDSSRVWIQRLDGTTPNTSAITMGTTAPTNSLGPILAFEVKA